MCYTDCTKLLNLLPLFDLGGVEYVVPYTFQRSQYDAGVSTLFQSFGVDTLS